MTVHRKYRSSLHGFFSGQRALPYDPIVESDAKWVIVPQEGEAKGNIRDLKSSGQGVARNGKPVTEL